MPNIVAHTFITQAAIRPANPDVVLGSTLPDFSGMYLDFTGRRHEFGKTISQAYGLTSALEAGYDLHVATDEVFDNIPLRVDAISRLSRELRLTNLGHRAVRLCSDPGTEILMDGALMDNREVTENFLHLADYVLSGRSSLEDITNKDFADFVKGYFARGLPVWYRDPEFVARLWQRRVTMHGKKKGKDFGFYPEHLPEVAAAFDEQGQRLHEIGGVLIKQTIHDLRAREVAKAIALPSIAGVWTRMGSISGLEPESHRGPDTPDDILAMKPRSIKARSLLRNALRDIDVSSPPHFAGPATITGIPMPGGFVGSVTHTKKTNWAAAAVARAEDYAGVGIDIERLVRPGSRWDLSRKFLAGDEASLGIPDLPLTIACGKESAYKAMSRYVNNGDGRRVGFAEIELLPIGVSAKDTMIFSGEPKSERLADELAGRYLEVYIRQAGGHALSLATLSNSNID